VRFNYASATTPNLTIQQLFENILRPDFTGDGNYAEWMVKRVQSLHNRERQSGYQLLSNCSGVTAIEYALIAALIAVAAIAAFSLVGTNLSTTFSNIASCL
jgi:pilus assembly protein Flp/PilA